MPKLLPRTLRGRFIVTTVAVALTVAVSTVAIGAALTTRAMRMRASAQAAGSLGEVRDYMSLITYQMGARTRYFAARPDVASALRSHDATSLGFILGAAFPIRENRSIVVLDTHGGVLAKAGEYAGLLTTSAGFTDGARLLGGGANTQPAVVVVRAIPTTGAPAGAIVVAYPIGKRAARGFQTVSGSPMSLAPAGSATSGPEWTALDMTGFRDARYSLAGARTRVMATYLGTDGNPVVDMRVDRTDAALGQAEAAAWWSLLAATAIAVLIGTALSVAVSDRIRAPIESMVGRVEAESRAVMNGEPYSGESLDDEGLTVEFRQLGAVVDGLLHGMSARQAQLERVTAATREAEEALAVTVNESPDAEILVQDGVIRIANPATNSHFGVAPQDLLGRTPREVFEEMRVSDADCVPLDWDELVTRASESPTRVRLTIAGRGERWLEVRATSPSGAAKGRLLLSARDITAARHLEQLRDELVSMVGHDLRSPLTVITGYLDLLGTDLPASVRREAVVSARANAERLDAMLDDLAEAARAEQVFVPRAFDPVDVCALAEEIAISLRGSSPEHPVEVHCEGSPTVLGEERRIRQAIMNLAANAAKYSPRGTPVVIRIETDDESVRVVVEDEGPGIPDESKLSIFDRFTRIGTSSGRPGMGLGLYIVRIVAEGHRGVAYVQDRQGGGSRFVIEMPRPALADPAA
jgi:two-component system, OmpR family, phosphate regulon sensor histidine kinase PhoR